MLDIWRNVFVMWVRRGQSGIIGMGEIIVPIKLLRSKIYLVAVRSDESLVIIEFLTHAQTESAREQYLTFGDSCVRTGRPDVDGRSLHGRLTKSSATNWLYAANERSGFWPISTRLKPQ